MARLPRGSPAGGSDPGHAARLLMEAASALSLTVGNLAALAELLWVQRSSACQQEMCHDLAQLAPCAAAARSFKGSAATSTASTGQRQLVDLTKTLLQAQEQLLEFRVLAGHLGVASTHASSPSLALDRGVHLGACSSNALGPHMAPPIPMPASTTSSEKSTAYLDENSALLPIKMEEDVRMQASAKRASNESHCNRGADVLNQCSDENAGVKRTRCSNGDRMDGSRRSPRKPKVPTKQIQVIVPETFDEKQIPDDGWSWRKYGKKPIKSSPNPRNYFRCSLEDSDQPCLAKKQVEVSKDDKNVFVVTYRGYHNHAAPPNPITISLISQAGGPPIDIAIFEGQDAGFADVAAAGSGAEDMEDYSSTPSSSKSLEFSPKPEAVDSFFSSQSEAGPEKAHVLHAQYEWRLPFGEIAEADNGFAPLDPLDFMNMRI
eukprot:SM000021S06502  [mRNA]  locus=s21:703101:705034:- [translate_table: standard]